MSPISIPPPMRNGPPSNGPAPQPPASSPSPPRPKPRNTLHFLHFSPKKTCRCDGTKRITNGAPASLRLPFSMESRTANMAISTIRARLPTMRRMRWRRAARASLPLAKPPARPNATPGSPRCLAIGPLASGHRRCRSISIRPKAPMRPMARLVETLRPPRRHPMRALPPLNHRLRRRSNGRTRPTRRTRPAIRSPGTSGRAFRFYRHDPETRQSRPLQGRSP